MEWTGGGKGALSMGGTRERESSESHSADLPPGSERASQDRKGGLDPVLLRPAPAHALRLREARPHPQTPCSAMMPLTSAHAQDIPEAKG